MTCVEYSLQLRLHKECLCAASHGQDQIGDGQAPLANQKITKVSVERFVKSFPERQKNALTQEMTWHAHCIVCVCVCVCVEEEESRPLPHINLMEIMRYTNEWPIDEASATATDLNVSIICSYIRTEGKTGRFIREEREAKF